MRISDTPDFRPRVYCASPYPRAKMWQTQIASTILGPDINIVSTWHDDPQNEMYVTPERFTTHWQQDFKEIKGAHVLLAYAEAADKPQGTLVEIGYALAHDMPVHIVGNHKWASWKYHPNVTQHDTLREAVISIIRNHNDTTKNLALHR